MTGLRHRWRRLLCSILGCDMWQREFEYDRGPDAHPATLAVCARCGARLITLLPRGGR